MLDKALATRAAEALDRAERFGIGPISEEIITAIERVLAGLAEPPSSCPDGDHDHDALPCSDDHIQGGAGEDTAGRH